MIFLRNKLWFATFSTDICASPGVLRLRLGWYTPVNVGKRLLQRGKCYSSNFWSMALRVWTTICNLVGLSQQQWPTIRNTAGMRVMPIILHPSHRLTDDTWLMFWILKLVYVHHVVSQVPVPAFQCIDSNTHASWITYAAACCIPIYGCPLWCSMYQHSYRKLNVAYNEAFRQLLHEPRWCSASQLLVANNVSSFAANIRKLVYSLWRSLNASDNVLVNTALRSYLLVRSPVFGRWRNILF